MNKANDLEKVIIIKYLRVNSLDNLPRQSMRMHTRTAETIFDDKVHKNYNNKIKFIFLNYLIKHDENNIKLAGKIFRSINQNSLLHIQSKCRKCLFNVIYGWKIDDEEFNCKLLCSLKLELTNQVFIQMCTIVKIDAYVLTLYEHLKKIMLISIK